MLDDTKPFVMMDTAFYKAVKSKHISIHRFQLNHKQNYGHIPKGMHHTVNLDYVKTEIEPKEHVKTFDCLLDKFIDCDIFAPLVRIPRKTTGPRIVEMLSRKIKHKQMLFQIAEIKHKHN